MSRNLSGDILIKTSLLRRRHSALLAVNLWGNVEIPRRTFASLLTKLGVPVESLHFLQMSEKAARCKPTSKEGREILEGIYKEGFWIANDARLKNTRKHWLTKALEVKFEYLPWPISDEAIPQPNNWYSKALG